MVAPYARTSRSSQPDETGTAVYIPVTNAVDFDDMILRPALAASCDPDFAKRSLSRWPWLMVDEGQDLSPSQIAMLDGMLAKHKNITLVGDMDQAVYGWRGADRGLLGRFSEKYPGTTVIRLGTNYRCNPEIVTFASAIIEKQDDRAEKHLRSARPSGSMPSEQVHADGQSEALAIAASVAAAIEQGTLPGEVAVLSRVSRLLPPIAEELARRRIPHEVWGQKFYDQAEVKDVMAFARLMDDQSRLDDFVRLLGVPNRGFGPTALARVMAAYPGASPAEALAQAASTDGFEGNAEACASFAAAVLEAARRRAANEPREDVLRGFVDASGFRSSVPADNAEAIEVRANIDAAIAACGRFETQEAWEDHAAATQSRSKEKDVVVLATMHASKGHEWQVVHLAGWEDHLVPHKAAIEDGSRDGLAEERNLAYVAATRAKDQLVIHRAMHRDGEQSIPSRFLLDATGHYEAGREPQDRPVATTGGSAMEGLIVGALARETIRLNANKARQANGHWRRLSDGTLAFPDTAIADATGHPLVEVRATLGRLHTKGSAKIPTELLAGQYFAGLRHAA